MRSDTHATNESLPAIETQLLRGPAAILHARAIVGYGDIHYVEGGRGLPLVLIHGGFGSWAHWLANIGALADEYHVIAVDLQGFGESGDPGRCLQPNEHAELLAAFFDQLGITGAIVAGFSFGTLVSTELAKLRPDLVSALALVSLPGVGERTREALALPKRIAALARERGKRAGVEAVLRELMLSNRVLITPTLVDLITKCNEQTRYVTRSISRQSQMIPELERLSVPTAVLLGALDPYHSNELEGRRARIDRALRRQVTTIVANAAHWLQYDQPEAFATTIRSLASASRTSRARHP